MPNTAEFMHEVVRQHERTSDLRNFVRREVDEIRRRNGWYPDAEPNPVPPEFTHWQLTRRAGETSTYIEWRNLQNRLNNIHNSNPVVTHITLPSLNPILSAHHSADDIANMLSLHATTYALNNNGVWAVVG
jgi:hypothetical protein